MADMSFIFDVLLFESKHETVNASKMAYLPIESDDVTEAEILALNALQKVSAISFAYLSSDR